MPPRSYQCSQARDRAEREGPVQRPTASRAALFGAGRVRRERSRSAALDASFGRRRASSAAASATRRAPSCPAAFCRKSSARRDIPHVPRVRRARQPTCTTRKNSARRACCHCGRDLDFRELQLHEPPRGTRVEQWTRRCRRFIFKIFMRRLFDIDRSRIISIIEIKKYVARRDLSDLHDDDLQR